MNIEISDPRLNALVVAVLARLPARDRTALEEQVVQIADNSPGPGLGYAIPHELSDGIVRPRIELAPRLTEESDAAALFVIVHELGHAILRHPQLAVVVECDIALRAGSADAWGDLRQTTELAATLQAVFWGFAAEYAAFLVAHPGARRLPGW